MFLEMWYQSLKKMRQLFIILNIGPTILLYLSRHRNKPNFSIKTSGAKRIIPQTTNTEAIYYFEHRTEINIIGETDNYYFITYTDDDGNEVTGYSEKENIEIVPE